MKNRPIIDTTRHDTPLLCSKIAVIGNIKGVLHVSESISKSNHHTCVLAVAEDYPASNFTPHLLHLRFREKLSLLKRTAKVFHASRGRDKSILRKIPSVYFTPGVSTPESLGLIPSNILSSADLFLIACNDDEENIFCRSSDYVSELLRLGISKDRIFIVPKVMVKAKIPITNGESLSPLCRNIRDIKPAMRYIEYHVTDFCNLKCKGCGHLANYVKELEFPGIESFKLSLSRLAEKFSNITTIRIMGGEPLLCKNLHEYIDAAHEAFPYSHVKIVTNGLLYKHITTATIDAIKRAGAEIQVTQYPPTREIVSELAAFCHDNGLAVSISAPVSEFFRREVSGNNADFVKCWCQCESRYCHFLHGTSLYPCPRVWTHHDERFKPFTLSKGITDAECQQYTYDLSQDIPYDGWDILRKFDAPMKLCAKCGDKKTFFGWQSEA